jgi:ABC-type nitrate/sulfonate/bicarbonate transport system ATPase subunit
MPIKIRVEGVAKSFATEQGELSVLDNISLDVADGETVAIVGPSGCGKSTLMNILAGFGRTAARCISTACCRPVRARKAS